jgi:hypothetical protein
MLMLFHQRDTNLLQHFIRSDFRGNISPWLTVEPVAARKTSGMSRLRTAHHHLYAAINPKSGDKAITSR